MMWRYLLAAAFFLFTVSANGQSAVTASDLANYGVRIEPDKRLIVVLAALEMAEEANAAGEAEKLIKTPLSEKGTAFRAQLKQDFADMSEDLRRKISVFVAQHKRRHSRLSDAEIVAPFISMAYTLGPVPDLGDPSVTSDLPGALLDVLDFAPLVREFYRRSSISGRLDGYARSYVADVGSILSGSARAMVNDVLGYLHTKPQLTIIERIVTETQKTKGKQTLKNTSLREQERWFNLNPEKLSPRGNVSFLNIKDDYFVIVPPDTDLSQSDARRAYIQFVIDPLVLKNAKEIGVFRAWAKPILDEKRKTNPAISPDIFLAVSRSLVAAVDVRQSEYAQLRAATDDARGRITQVATDPGKRAVSAELERKKKSLADEAALRLFEDHEKGAILAFYFADQLRGLEDSGFDIASSIKEIIASFDPQKEGDRAASTLDARTRALAAREARRSSGETVIAVAESPVTRRLLDVQKLIDAKQYAAADKDLKQLLTENPSEPRVYYTLGRVASLTAGSIEDPEVVAQKLLDAKVAFGNVLRTATPTTDKALLSLTYVALARIYEHMDDDAYAVKLYEKAIELTDVAGGAYRDAFTARQRLVKP